MLINIRDLFTCIKLFPLVATGGMLPMLVLLPLAIVKQLMGPDKDLPKTIKQSEGGAGWLLLMLVVAAAFQVIPWLYYRRYQTVIQSGGQESFLSERLAPRTAGVLAIVVYVGTAVLLAVISAV